MNAFQKGDRICFIGDSITHGNNFVTRIAAWYGAHLPEREILFKNAGVSGGSAESALLYFDEDVVPFRPTVSAVMLGVNDSWRTELEKPASPERDQVLRNAYDGYCERMEKLVLRLREIGSRVILCTPAPYAEFLETGQKPLPGGFALIQRYAEAVRALARKYGLDLVDWHARMSELYLIESELYREDHVHPLDRGHWRMTEWFLLEQGLTPDAFAPIEEVTEKAGLTRWAENVARLRNLYASEWMIVKNYTLPLEEKLAFVRDYVAREGWNGFEYFHTLALEYLDWKPRQAELVRSISGEMRRFAEGGRA